ncbi:MAG: sterol desaturase family protein [Sphingomonadales bacterium]
MLSQIRIPAPLAPWRALSKAALGGALYAAIFLASIGCALAVRLVVHPNSQAAREALSDLAHGAVDFAPALVLAGVLAILLLKPLAVIAVISSLELLLAGGRVKSKDWALMWLVQALSLGFATSFVVAIQHLGLIPGPILAAWRGGSAVGGMEALGLFLLLVLIKDFLSYWVHRAHHTVPILWRFHAVHHAPDVDCLHAIGHPVETVVTVLLVAVPAAILVGAPAEHLYLLVSLVAIQSNIVHSKLPIHYGRFHILIADNRFHFVHHSLDAKDFGRNFAGIFPIFDLLFGTYRPPAGAALPATGLSDKGAPGTLGQYLTARLPDRTEAGAADRRGEAVRSHHPFARSLAFRRRAAVTR